MLADSYEVDKRQARKSLKESLYKKLEAAKVNHQMVLVDAKISTNFASITAIVVRERLSQSSLDTVFRASVRDIAIANKVNVFTRKMHTVDIHYVDHNTGDAIETVRYGLSTLPITRIDEDPNFAWSTRNPLEVP